MKTTTTRSRFEYPAENIAIHYGTCPCTGEPFTRRYTVVGEKSGYVYLDTTKDGSRPGTLGTQPTTDGGSTWWTTRTELRRLIKREWRKERDYFRSL